MYKQPVVVTLPHGPVRVVLVVVEDISMVVVVKYVDVVFDVVVEGVVPVIVVVEACNEISLVI